jgi:SAM-dependent methyltransferase
MFDHYLSAGFLAANPSDFGSALKEFDLNYSGLLPTDPHSAILDLGCGMGHFLYYLQQKGFANLRGVDVSGEAVEFCRQNVTRSVEQIADPVEYLNAHGGMFDLVVLKDVIEHLPRERVVPTLVAIRAALKPGGRLLVETGNMAAWSGPYLLFNDYTHTGGFTETSLRYVLTLGGFSEIRVSGNRVPQGWRGKLMSGAWTRVLRLIYRIERGPRGVPAVLTKLLIAVAQK